MSNVKKAIKNLSPPSVSVSDVKTVATARKYLKNLN